MNNKQVKLENPMRLEELKPMNTLKKIGLQENHIVCDIGAGSGIFSIPASMITRNKVYALEISDEMLSIIGEKAKVQGVTNIELIKVKDEHFDVLDDSINIALMVTVLHEIPNKIVILEEVKRILMDQGKLAVIEFHKRETPMGPPVEHRIGKNVVIDTLNNSGFLVADEFDLGENFYCLVFRIK